MAPSVDIDLQTAFAAPRRCPACRASALTPLRDHRGLVFRCAACTRVWVSELGALVPAPVPQVRGARASRGRPGDRATT